MNREQTINEIIRIRGRIKAVQDECKLSDNQLINNYPDIGSQKTWRHRLLEANWDELNLDRTLEKLRRVEAIIDGGMPDEVFYKDLPFAVEMRTRLVQLERQMNDRRILVCLAPNGTGKSAWSRWEVSQKRASRAWVRCRPSWRNKIIHLCNGMISALQRPSDAAPEDDAVQITNVAEAEERVIRILKGAPRTVFIDQAHEGGVALMHLLRAFIDETPSRFVYLAYDTAYRRVITGSSDALIEAKAFLGRCLKPVFDLYKGGVRAEDVSFYLARVAGLRKDACDGVTKQVLATLRTHTNLRLLDDAITSAAATGKAGDPEPGEIVKQVHYLAGLEQARAEEKEGA
jgi:hypothetical protein